MPMSLCAPSDLYVLKWLQVAVWSAPNHADSSFKTAAVRASSLMPSCVPMTDTDTRA